MDGCLMSITIKETLTVTCVRVCVCLYLQHNEYPNTHSTSKDRTFLHSGAIFAGCHHFKCDVYVCTEQFVASLQGWFCSTSYEVSLICHFHGRPDQISSRFWKEDCQATVPCDLNTTTGDNVPVTACPLSHSRTHFLVSAEPICPGGSLIRSAKCGWSRMKYHVCHNSLAEATVGTRNRLRNTAGCLMIKIRTPS